MYMLTLKVQSQNLTLGQGHLRSRIEPSRSYCISFDASVQEKHIGIIPSALCLFYQKLAAKTNVTSYDLEWPKGEVIESKLHEGYREGPNVGISWDKQYVPTRTFRKNGIWAFSHCLIMVMSQNWPDLRSPKSKSWDICFVGIDALTRALMGRGVVETPPPPTVVRG